MAFCDLPSEIKPYLQNKLEKNSYHEAVVMEIQTCSKQNRRIELVCIKEVT